ncbi:hypothetical protein PQX77_014893 [Marasmius sp. AFHP31]|nr:hypothetical protein PQX77_014893 [Marasmius sp. AFHP31]
MASTNALTITIPEFAVLLVATFGLGVGSYALFQSLAGLISRRIGILKTQETEDSAKDALKDTLQPERGGSVPPRYSRLESEGLGQAVERTSSPTMKGKTDLDHTSVPQPTIREQHGFALHCPSLDSQVITIIAERSPIIDARATIQPDHDNTSPTPPPSPEDYHEAETITPPYLHDDSDEEISSQQPTSPVLSPVPEEPSMLGLGAFATSYSSVKSIQDRLANWQEWHMKRVSLAELSGEAPYPASSSESSLSAIKSVPSGTSYDVSVSPVQSGGSNADDHPTRAPFADLSHSRAANTNDGTDFRSTANLYFESVSRKPIIKYRNWMGSYKEPSGLTGSRLKVMEETEGLKSQAPGTDHAVPQRTRARALSELVKALGGSGGPGTDLVREEVKTPMKKTHHMGSYWSPDTP